MHFTSRKLLNRSSCSRYLRAILVLASFLGLACQPRDARAAELTVDVLIPKACQPIAFPAEVESETGFHKACKSLDAGPAVCRRIDHVPQKITKLEANTSHPIQAPRSELFRSLVAPAGQTSAVNSTDEIQQVHFRATSQPCQVPPFEAAPCRQTVGQNASCYADTSICGLNGCGQIDWRHDWSTLHSDIWDDAKSIANVNNAMLLGIGLAASIGMRQGLDDDVRRATARHPERWGTASNVLGRFGEIQYQLPILGALYTYSVMNQDEELHQFTGTMVSAYTIAGLSTLTVKAIANTDRPSDEWNGGMFGFPSFHTSSSFALAAVADEYYGPKAGLPAYAMAGLIAWSRIDERDHDLSDVVFGATLGYVIGKAVAGKHLHGDSRVQVLPFLDPIQGGGGLLFNIDF